jgi:GntR family transcriptional regulator
MNTTDEPELVLDGSGPIAGQIEAQIGSWVVAGVLRPGETLPTVRGLAVALAVNPRNIEKAYEALERDGLVLSADDSGPVVAALTRPAGGAHAATARLQRLCTDFLDRAAAEGFSADEVFGAIGGLFLRRSAP